MEAPTGAEGATFITIADVVHGGLTTSFAIGVATGLTTREIELLMAGRLDPTAEQYEATDQLLRNYELAIKLLNAATMKQGLETVQPAMGRKAGALPRR